MGTIIIGIESSCDDTSAAIVKDGFILSNIIANQDVHRQYGGVVPELASRAHQQNIIPVVDRAIKVAGITKDEIDGVAFTRGPGLLGSLLVGSSFAKGFALGQKIPLIEINHLQAHILANFIRTPNEHGELTMHEELPGFPFISLLVSGGNSQLVVVKDYFDMEVIGQTIDDAAGEAFDKCGKLMGLPYPAGPVIDKLAQQGNKDAFTFSKPSLEGFNYSFSGLKTSFLYFLRDQLKTDPDFIENNKFDLCASLQYTIVDILMNKLKRAIKQTELKTIVLAGGVAANSELRKALCIYADKLNLKLFIPPIKYTTDNAAMIAISGFFKYLNKEFVPQTIAPMARLGF